MTASLYPADARWWSYADHLAVVGVVQRLGARRVLEFGPGSSTLSLIEGGATHVDSCEDAPKWAVVYEDRLQGRFPGIVHIRRYQWAEPLSIQAVDGQHYDLALIDGPLGTMRRPVAIAYALQRCDAVLLPTEDHETEGAGLRKIVTEMAAMSQRSLEIWDTGPLSGGFALVGGQC